MNPELQELLETLEARFHSHPERHQGILWDDVAARLHDNPEKLRVLFEMELTGGEPDVVMVDSKTNAFVFFDCSKESPKGRRSVCYDHPALEARKEHKPKNSALNMAKEMGITMLDEAQTRFLQTLGDFDTKSSSWIITPPSIRNLGGAIFSDFRYQTVFVYHNGADSYYGARGFRGAISI
ncbi:DUF4256 domain-containing protein [Erysipelothrix sp. HDW6C]|uniref:DUF4256 domain-containing protein n=1 Tax=Erysipelothrix sp. HDW6C TaxID=2714930 RepID=UPI00140721F0|nr:DUF4256 domain-containing protein [Erysipelothrix sp. HDW6C]QIK70623.1 DUF4256 domain-containing protein [Erysipelothrix sp. HDW6C]